VGIFLDRINGISEQRTAIGEQWRLLAALWRDNGLWEIDALDDARGRPVDPVAGPAATGS
jgi:hypothetical protein